jgi:hypothetical protein
MAIVFVSPKQRQKMFFLGITILFLLFLSVVGAVVFFSKPEPTPVELAFTRPKIEINLEVLDSEQIKGSLIMTRMQKEFIYSAETDKGVKKAGSVFAATTEEATKKIEDMKLIIIDLKEVEVGRENPFTPYYTIANTKK